MTRGSSPLAVEIRDLHFSFGDLEVLRGLSLDIPRGRVVAILGGSGSGKSTLLKLIGAQLYPTRGTVTVEGRNVHKLDSHELYRLRLGMGMMFQTSGLSPIWTCTRTSRSRSARTFISPRSWCGGLS